MNNIEHRCVQCCGGDWVVPIFEIPLSCDISSDLETAKGDIELLDLFIALEMMRIGVREE